MIPTYEDCMLPFLKAIEDGNTYKLADLTQNLSKHFQLSEAELKELLPSGKQTIFKNRIGWAKTYLKKAGLLESPKRAHFRITKRGKSILDRNPGRIDNSILMQFSEFVEFQKPTPDSPRNTHHIPNETHEASTTPEEVLEYAYQELRDKLANDLLERIKTSSPDFFEQLVVDLLLKMGYGGSRKEAGQTLGKSGDGGIDGIIKEDRLGLDIIYIQAKRWENPVPTREVRDFAGALLSKKARKGIFLTTSSFPKSAWEFVDKIEHKIILIDGIRLTDLMIENNVGLSISDTYHIKKIDTDYFEAE
ncbi:MAG: restriction endonuclease [Bacteroidetes bacterium]|nr:MAG: restriction endonuclease [Bacteroidota bacterium]